MKKSLFLLVKKLLSENNIFFDKNELAFQIESHPSYPSLHAITGVLDHFNIENVAAEVPTNKETLDQLPESFIAQTSSESGQQLVTVIRQKDKSSYKIFSELGSTNIVSESEFLESFTGIIVAVEADENTKSTSNNWLKSTVLFAILICTSLAILFLKNTPLSNFFFMVLSIAGIIASYSILNQELGESTVIGEAFCSGSDEKKDCDAVLTSKGAEIIKGHKLSDLSIIYFSGLLLISLLTTNLQPLYIISFLALPITFYSIFYQYKVVKSWCALCLTIVGILWLQAIIGFTETKSFSTSSILNLNNILVTTTSFIAVYLVWMYIKPLVKKAIDLQKEKVEFVKFKRNFNLFQTLLNKSTKINTEIPNTKEIIFGNVNAPLEIVTVTNPFCGHCKPVHNLVNDILDKHKDDAKIIVRFNVPAENMESKATIVATKLIELYNEKGMHECKKAMNDIYGELNFEEWIAKWGNPNKSDIYLDVVKNEKDWCAQHAINFTPEVLTNGKSFPKEYQRTDLIYFIEDLQEAYTPIAEIQS